MQKLNVNEMEELVEAGGNYIVDFYADWCAPCRALAPLLEEIDSEGSVKVIKIDVDQAEVDGLQKYGINSIPTIYAFKEGKAVTKMIGAQSKSKLLKSFE